MPVFVASRRRTRLSLDFPDALILDVTSRGPEPWVRLSPFYPHGGIPVPGHPDRTSQSVEGLWQALKVFATEPEGFTKRWMLDHRAARLRELASHQTVVLLDYTTNGDITDLSAPLSPAALIAQCIEGPSQAGPDR
jgi:hypothetical protein